KERSWTPNSRQMQQIEDRMFSNLRNPVLYAVSFSRTKRRSRLDAGARWGQAINIYYRHTPFAAGGTNAAATHTHFALHSAIFLPGLSRHHALALQFNWQEG